MEKRYFSKKIVEWYERNKRDLPWRQHPIAYNVWLSEIILQQTRVSQGLPYYHAFSNAFPDIHALASAPEQQVLRLWQGLGYYTRARNLHACAKSVIQDYGGSFPTSFEELKKLPGIGDYTAAAIASICFHQPVAVVDGNVFRVLSRLYGISTPINSPAGKKEFTALANSLVPDQEPGIFNQAMMEFGALHCTPQNPSCDNCPFKQACVANQQSLQASLPVKEKAKKARKRYLYYFVVEQNNAILMNERKGKDIWSGLYDFYLVEKKRPTSPDTIINEDATLRALRKVNPQPEVSGLYKHVLTHQHLYSRFIRLRTHEKISLSVPGMKFYSRKKIAALPKPVLINRFLKDSAIL
jgi:A/G-specific adenine glycosylase